MQYPAEVARLLLAALAADRSHVLPVLADRQTALAARLARLVRGELVGRALGMGGLSALAGDLALLGAVHRGEPATAGAAADVARRRLDRLGGLIGIRVFVHGLFLSMEAAQTSCQTMASGKAKGDSPTRQLA